MTATAVSDNNTMVKLGDAGWLDYVRFVFSGLLVIFSTVVTFYAIIEQKTSFFPEVVPGWAALIMFLIVVFWLGVVEGLQLALVELKRLSPDSYKMTHPKAHAFMQIVNKGDNLERFLMGRQVDTS